MNMKEFLIQVYRHLYKILKAIKLKKQTFFWQQKLTLLNISGKIDCDRYAVFIKFSHLSNIYTLAIYFLTQGVYIAKYIYTILP